MRVNYKQLTEALRLLKKFTGPLSRSAPPYQGCAVLRIGERTITLHKRDGDEEIAVDVLCESGPLTPRGSLTVPIDKMQKAIKAIKPDALGGIELEPVPERPAQIRVGALVLDAGIAPADLPLPLDTLVALRPINGTFLDALSAVAPTISQDPTRSELGGAWIDGPLLATDGHRMHLCVMPDSATLLDHDDCGPTNGDADGLVPPFFPRRIVETILTLKRPADLGTGFRHFTKPGPGDDKKNPAHLLDGAWTCMAGTLRVNLRWQVPAGGQPDWRQLQPSHTNTQITLPVESLRSELRLFAAHLPDNFDRYMIFRCAANVVTLRGTNDDGQILDRPLAPTSYQIDGAAGTAAFNLHYLEEAIDAVSNGANVTLAFNLEDSPAYARADPDPEFPRGTWGPPMLLTSEGSTRRALVMPIRP